MVAVQPLISVTKLPLNQDGGLQGQEETEVFMILERENCQDLVTSQMELVRKRKELRLAADSGWVTSGPSLLLLRDRVVRTGNWFEEKGEVMNLV